MRTWWRGTTLVAERGLVENIRSRSFKVLTGLLKRINKELQGVAFGSPDDLNVVKAAL